MSCMTIDRTSKYSLIKLLDGGTQMNFAEFEQKRYAELLKSELGMELFPNGHRVAGVYRGKVRAYTIDPIYSDENLEPGIREDAINYLSKIDSERPGRRSKRKYVVNNSLCHSNTAYLNFWFAFNRHPEKLKQLLISLGYPVDEMLNLRKDTQATSQSKPIYVGFEWGGEKDYLRTHFFTLLDIPQFHSTICDFYFRFKRTDGKIQTVIGEWKYTEGLQFSGRILKPRLKEKIKEFKRFISHLNLPKNINRDELAFDPFRQLMRLQILASEMEKVKEQKSDIVSLLMVTPKENNSINNDIIPQGLGSLGKSIFEIWEKIAQKDRFKGVHREDLFNLTIENECYPNQEWLNYLVQRYNMVPYKTLPFIKEVKDIEIKEVKDMIEKTETVLPQRYAVVDNPIEMELIQTELRDKFLENSDEVDQVGKLPINQWSVCQLDVSENKDVWYLYNLHTDMPGTRKDRYWNILGSGEYEHWSLAEVELNIPLKSNRSMQAAFVKDDEGKRYLVHRGRFRGKKTFMKIADFMNKFNGEKIVAGEGKKLQEFAVIACLDDNGEKFIQDVAKFLNEVIRIKTEFNNKA